MIPIDIEIQLEPDRLQQPEKLGTLANRTVKYADETECLIIQ